MKYCFFFLTDFTGDTCFLFLVICFFVFVENLKEGLVVFQ